MRGGFVTEPKRTLKGSNRRITVNVTEKQIEQAEKTDSSHCMVADALRVAVPDATSISVDLVTIRFTDPVKRQRFIYLTPLSVQQALVDFDQGRHNEPFRFALVKAMQVVESGGRTRPDGTRAKNPNRAVQGVVGASGRRQPTKLGGDLPPVGPLGSKGSRRKAGELTAAEKRAVAAVIPAASAKVPPKKLTAAEKRAAATRKAEEQVAGRDRGEPVSKTGSNITLAATPSRVRKFGMKQLRA
jgi:hypothetical protein